MSRGYTARVAGLKINSGDGTNSEANKKLHDSLFVNTADRFVVSSSPKVFSAIHPDDITDNFYISDKELEAYAQGFLDIATKENIESILLDKAVEDESLSNVALDDSDIKLSLYRSFKSYTINGYPTANQKVGEQLKAISLIIMILKIQTVELYSTILGLLIELVVTLGVRPY